MSKAITDPSKEYESANGGPEKSFGDTEVKDGVDEGEESDEYGEIEDEVCVQRNHIAKIWVFNLFWQDEPQERQIVGGNEEDEDEGEGVCVCAQLIFMYSSTTHIIYRKNKTRSLTFLSEM